MTTWNRKDIKEKAKTSFKANFWKCVATALILAVVGGGSAGAFGGSGGNAFSNRDGESGGHSINLVNEDWNFSFDADMNDDEGNILIGVGPIDEQDESTEEITEAQEEPEVIDIPAEAMVAFVVVMAVASLFIFAIALAVDAFIANPLELGCKRFFRRNLDEPASISNIAFAFDSNYKNICKTMFLRDLYTVLWCMLFIIPGVVKAYEYKMIPYLLSENPEMTTEQAFAESKKLMTGNKWKAFVLDLSFILWDIASILTCGLAGIFWVAPYKASTQAALYEAVKYGTTTEAKAVNA